MFEQYPYFFAGLLGLLPVGLAYLLYPRHRKNMLIATLIWLPSALMSQFFHGYWQPSRILGYPLGIEDFIYIIDVTPLAWLFAVLICESWLCIAPGCLLDFRRFSELVILGLAAMTGLTLIDFDAMSATLCTNLILSVFVLWHEHSYWPLALAGLMVFPIFHLLELKLWFSVWPQFVQYWNQNLILGQQVLGIPMGEVFFLFSFVALCPLGVAYIRWVRLTPKTQAGS